MRHIYACFAAGLLLLARPIAAQAEFVSVSDDLRIHYVTAGNGPTPIVMVPGWTMSSAVFEKQLAHFSASDKYKVYAYDPRGQGLSSKTVEGHYYEQHGRDLKAFMDKLNLQGVILTGWSYAALDVMAYVHQFGDGNLKALVLIDGTPKSSGADEATEWVWYRTDDANGYRRSFTMPILEDRQTANKGFAEWMVENPRPEYMKWMLAIMNQTSDTVAALLNETGAYEDYSADLKALNGKLPLLYVVRQDWAKATATWAATNTPAAVVKVFPRHLSFWERPDEFNQNLDEFLASVK